MLKIKYKHYRTLLFTCVTALAVTVGGCRKNNENPITTTRLPTLYQVADGMVSPLGVAEAPDDSKRLFIIDQVGKIWVVKDGKKLDEPFLDLTSKIVALTPQYDERGLLGLAFHPAFKTNGKFYVFYTAPPRAGGPEAGVNWNNLTRISEFRAVPTADKADMSSERIILEADHPQMNHNGGTLAFGYDGFLYISIGDGGGSNDVGPGHVTDWYAVNKGGNAQNIHANLMGKVLRIDVNNGNPYAIPGDNPYANTTARGEIWAYGLRNPYRFSFDMGGNHQLLLGDAGQKLFEEINIIERGGNYGWNIREGEVCFNADSNTRIRANCPIADSMGNMLRTPWLGLKNAAHPDGGGKATVVVGGNVYRGSLLPSYNGLYIFGIYSQSANPDAKLYASRVNSTSYAEFQLKDYPNNLGMYLKGFGQDLAGEIYITTSMQGGVSGTTGKVFKIVPAQ